MWVGVLAALGAGLLWGLVFLVPLVLGDYPGVVLAFGRYTAFGILALGLAWVDRVALAKLSRADWFEAAKLSLIGNILYYAALASAIQLAGAPMPTLIIGTLPVVIAVTANLLDRRAGRVEQALEWRRLAWPLLLIIVGLMVVQLGPTHAGEVPASTVVEIVELPTLQRPEKSRQPQQAEAQRRGDQPQQHLHQTRARFSRRALAITSSDDVDMATAAISGVTRPATASGRASRL